MLIIFNPFMIISWFHSLKNALFKMIWHSNACLLAAIATNLLDQWGGSNWYESRYPKRYPQNEPFLIQHRTQSPSSTSSHREHGCCTQTRFGFPYSFQSHYYFIPIHTQWQDITSPLSLCSGIEYKISRFRSIFPDCNVLLYRINNVKLVTDFTMIS